MKKTLTFMAALLVSSSAMGANISCVNVDEYWEEDSLEFYQEGKTTYASYFDNDSYRSIPCETTMLDGYFCEGEGLEVTLYESGSAIVEYSNGQTVDFDCL